MAGVSSPKCPRRKQATSEFRVGKVKGYLRGSIWYLCYYEDGKRLRPRVGNDRTAAERLAAKKKLLSGKTVAVDSTTLEANAAMKSIVRKDTGEDYKLYLTKLANDAGIEDPSEGISQGVGGMRAGSGQIRILRAAESMSRCVAEALRPSVR